MRNIFSLHTIIKVPLLIFFVFTPILSGVDLHAQTSLDSRISIQASPATPKPNQNVSLQVITYQTDINRVPISWYIDGELAQSETGGTSFSFNVGDSGTRTTIKAVVSIPGTGNITKTIVFIPAEVDILWEAANSYTPPFYKGKALPASQETLHVVAMPNFITTDGTVLSKNNLVYTWKRNGVYKDLHSQSGYGKNTVEFQNSILIPVEDVRVEVSSPDNTLHANGITRIQTVDPKGVVYFNHPLQGVLYEQAITTDVAVNNSEVTLVGEPYFFSMNNAGVDISFNWRIDNTPVINNGENTHILTIRNQNGENRELSVSLDIANIKKILQSAQSKFSLKFGIPNDIFDFSI